MDYVVIIHGSYEKTTSVATFRCNIPIYTCKNTNNVHKESEVQNNPNNYNIYLLPSQTVSLVSDSIGK